MQCVLKTNSSNKNVPFSFTLCIKEIRRITVTNLLNIRNGAEANGLPHAHSRDRGRGRTVADEASALMNGSGRYLIYTHGLIDEDVLLLWILGVGCGALRFYRRRVDSRMFSHHIVVR